MDKAQVYSMKINKDVVTENKIIEPIIKYSLTLN